MQVEILGTGTAVPSLRRLSSSYLVSVGPLRLLVDVGPSVVRRLLEAGHTVDDVDAILLTHFHIDHTADLSTFLFACNYGSVERKKPLTIVGGKGISLFHRRLSRLYPWIVPKGFQLSVKSTIRDTLRLGPVSVSWATVNHREESVAFRIEEVGPARKSVVFSGDTDYAPSLAELATGADLLVVECAFPERKVKGHLNLETLLPLVRQASPGKVILSHLHPEWDYYRAPLPAPLLLAEDGMKIDL
jgi:ribonuclease BN (tRNA processing enzyme)